MVVCITLLFALLGFTSFGDTSCEAYKQQVIADCNNTLQSITSLRGDLNDIHSANDAWANWCRDVSTPSGYWEYYNVIDSEIDSARNLLTSINNTVTSIRDVASDLVCNSSDGSCDCASVLGDIDSKLGYVQTLVSSIAGSNHTDISYKLTQIINKLSSFSSSNTVDLSTIEFDLNSVKSDISSMKDVLDGVYYYLDNDIIDTLDAYRWFVSWHEDGSKNFLDLYKLISGLAHSVTNSSGTLSQGMSSSTLRDYWQNYRLVGVMHQGIGPVLSFWRNASLKNRSINALLNMGFIQTFEELSSLNNWAHDLYLNGLGISNEVVVGFSSISNITDSISAITNTLVEQFSIFANDSPLKGTTEKPDKYYDYLTNYYIKVSVNPSGSASEPYTNWFNRIEMLLAALVFKTDKAVSNDFTTANTDSMRGALDSALDNVRGIQDNSQSVITTVEKSSRSLLNVMGQWDDKLTMAASLPSHIEFVDLGGSDDGGGSKRASDPSSGVDTKIGIDLSSGPLKVFVDSCRAISTLCWIFVFIFAGWGVARFMVSKFLTVIKLCYSIFKVALGLG